MANDRIGPMILDTTEVVSAVIGDKALLSAVADDTSIEVNSTTGKLRLKPQGSSLANGVQRDQMSAQAGTILAGALGTSASAGGLMSVENTYGTDFVVELILKVTTGPTAGFVADLGIGASGTTLYDTLIDGVTIAGTTGGDDAVYSSSTDAGTNGQHYRVWPSGEFITGSVASGSAAGMVGRYMIRVLDPA